MGAVQCSEDRSVKYISTSDVELLVCVYVCVYMYLILHSGKVLHFGF